MKQSGGVGETKLWCASCGGGKFRELSGRQLLLELNAKVCGSETSVSKFGLWRGRGGEDYSLGLSPHP